MNVNVKPILGETGVNLLCAGGVSSTSRQWSNAAPKIPNEIFSLINQRSTHHTYKSAAGSARSLMISLIIQLINVMASVMSPTFSRVSSVSRRAFKTLRSFMSKSCASRQVNKIILRSKSTA
jgi:hypothetical protein